jgi:hypothetical protein
MKLAPDMQNDNAEPDATTDQKFLEMQDRMEAIEGIRRGLESMKRNAGKPAEKSGSFSRGDECYYSSLPRCSSSLAK